MRHIRVGVVGAGFGARVHVPAFRSDRRCEVVGICARRSDRARQAAAALSVDRWYDDWREMIDAVDAVAIATPPGLQPLIASTAIAAGKSVFCEKPLALTAAEATALAAQAEAAGVAHMIDFALPEIDAWRHAKTTLDCGAIGQLLHLSVSWKVHTYASRMRVDSWKTRRRDGGGALYNFGAHVLHYTEWLAGAIAQCSVSSPDRPDAADCCAELQMRLASGVVAGASIATNACIGRGHRIDLHGTEGTMILENRSDDYAHGFVVRIGGRTADAVETIWPSAPPLPAPADGRIVPVSRLVTRFLDWVETATPTRPSLADGARVQRLLEAAALAQDVPAPIGPVPARTT